MVNVTTVALVLSSTVPQMRLLGGQRDYRVLTSFSPLLSYFVVIPGSNPRTVTRVLT